MHRCIVVIVTLFLAAGVGAQQPPGARPPPTDAQRAVAAVLDNWHDAAAKADEARYFGHFAADAVFMGTDATERWTASEFRAWAKPYFDRGRAWSFTAHDRFISLTPDGRAAWFDEVLDTPNLGPCRGSGVLLLDGQSWRIAQYNLSVPIPNDLVSDFVKRISDYQARQATPPGALDLKVITFNIRYANAADGADAWEHRKGMVADLLRARSPDVVGLQEALRTQLDDLGAALPELGEIGVGRDDGKVAGEYAAILYRKDRLRPDQQGTFWLSDTPDVPGSKHWGNKITRICTWVRLTELAAGRSFYVFNVHLDHESQASREKSAGLLMDRVASRAHSDPVVITGDFNAGEDNPAVARVKQGALATAFVDTFRVLHPDQSVVGTFNGFKGDPTGAKIDYIFVPAIGASVLAADVVREARDGRYPSDHFPVGAAVRMLPAP